MYYGFPTYPSISLLMSKLTLTLTLWNITKLVGYLPIIVYITSPRSFEFETSFIWLSSVFVLSQILSDGIPLVTLLSNPEIRFQIVIFSNSRLLLLNSMPSMMMEPKMEPLDVLHSRTFYRFLDSMELPSLVKFSSLSQNVRL